MGGAQQALDITVQYSKEREQFDKPIGSFQSLAHYMADAQVEISGAQVLAWEAAWTYSEENLSNVWLRWQNCSAATYFAIPPRNVNRFMADTGSRWNTISSCSTGGPNSSR